MKWTLTSLRISADALADWKGMASRRSLYPPSRIFFQDSLYCVWNVLDGQTQFHSENII